MSEAECSSHSGNSAGGIRVKARKVCGRLCGDTIWKRCLRIPSEARTKFGLVLGEFVAKLSAQLWRKAYICRNG